MQCHHQPPQSPPQEPASTIIIEADSKNFEKRNGNTSYTGKARTSHHRGPTRTGGTPRTQRNNQKRPTSERQDDPDNSDDDVLMMDGIQRCLESQSPTSLSNLRRKIWNNNKHIDNILDFVHCAIKTRIRTSSSSSHSKPKPTPKKPSRISPQERRILG
eukprot:GEZU01026923.1.p1 GENE.GEZU01026923.1~~GEZU01026923.1.p1  ORF type:complete len:159 (-),score=22.36 GEZU01026923.1:97-573(-)